MHRCQATTNYPLFNRKRCSGLEDCLGDVVRFHCRNVKSSNYLRALCASVVFFYCRIFRLTTIAIFGCGGHGMPCPYMFYATVAAEKFPIFPLNWHIILPYQTQRIASLHPPYPPPELSHCRIAELAHWHINYYLAT